MVEGVSTPRLGRPAPRPVPSRRHPPARCGLGGVSRHVSRDRTAQVTPSQSWSWHSAQWYIHQNKISFIQTVKLDSNRQLDEIYNLEIFFSEIILNCCGGEFDGEKLFFVVLYQNHPCLRQLLSCNNLERNCNFVVNQVAPINFSIPVWKLWRKLVRN